LLSNSCALPISLSAITSGLTLKLPSAIACEKRATYSASNGDEPDSSAAAVLDSSTVALGSGVPGVAAAAAVGAPALAASTPAPWLVVGTTAKGFSAGLPIFMRFSKGSAAG
jgi:hypothetical protein